MREKQLSKKGRRAPEFSSNRFVEGFTVFLSEKNLGELDAYRLNQRIKLNALLPVLCFSICYMELMWPCFAAKP
jgi:hypothetical protein